MKMKHCRHDILDFLFLRWNIKFVMWICYKYSINCVHNTVDKLEIKNHVVGLTCCYYM
jgi:hypothetical protein